MNKRINTLLATAALLLAAPVAQAANFNFSGLIDSGSLNGQAFSGSFAYDDALSVADGEAPLTAFALELAGYHYTLADADAGALALFAGGSFIGLHYSDADGGAAPRPLVAFVAGYESFAEAYLAYDVEGGFGGAGSYSLSPVPEPAPLALLLGGLGVVATVTRWRKAAA